MLKYLKVAIFFLAFAVILPDVSAQQNVFSRSSVTTGNWGDGQLPWYYQTSNNDQGDPDNGNSTPNFVRFDHNNNRNMTLNGRAYRAREVIFEAAASLSRTIGGENLEMRPNNGNCKIENLSNSNHLFTNNVVLFAPTEINPVNGDLTFSGDIITNNNFIDIFGNNANSLIINGVINGTNGIGVQQNSTVILNGLNSYGGGTFINAGKIIVNSNNSLGSISGSTTVASGGILEIDDADQLSEPVFLNGFGQSNSGALRKVDSGTDQFSGTITLQSDARIHIDESNFDYLGTMNLGGFTLYLGGDGNFNFEASSSLTNATKTSFDGAIFKDGTGKLEFRPSTSMTGNFYFNNGEVRQFTGDWPSIGLLILDGDVVYRSDGSTNRDVVKPTRVDGNVTLGFGVGANSEIDFLTSVDFNGGNRTLTMTNDNFISGQMTNGSFTKAGSGSLTIEGSVANTLDDGSEVISGMLILAKDAGIQATAGLSIQSGAIVRTDNDNQWGTTAPPFIEIFGGTLNVNNTNQRLALAGDISASITLGSGSITIDGTGTDTFAGVISGSGGIVKEGVGKEILTGTNTYTGSTTITEGTLELGASDVLSNTSPIVLSGGTLRSTGTITETMGTLELTESSTIDLGGTGEDLAFANSSSITWNTEATLTIIGWSGSAEQSGTSSQIFLQSATDLTEDQLLQIQFVGYDFGARILPLTFELVPAIQNIKRFDNFNRGQDDIVGLPSGGNLGSWIELEEPTTNCAAGNFIEINASNQLQLTRGSGGICSANANIKMAAFDVSGEYATLLRDSEGLLEWYFNFRQTDNSPSASNRTAFVIGSTVSDFTSDLASGYAVVMGDQGVTPADEFKLIRFNGGIPTTNDFDSNEIIALTNSDTDGHYSIRVTFDPCSSEWTMAVRNDGTGSFRDPATLNTIGTSAIDFSNADLNLPFIGAYRRHSTTGTRTSYFDNIYIPDSPPAANSYVWNQPANGDYQNPNNWTPVRSCGRGGDILTFESGGSHIITNIPDEIIGQLIVQNNTSVTLRDAISGGPAPSRLTITGRSAGTDLIVTNGSSLIYDTGNNLTDNYLEIAIETGATGEISGNLDFTKSFSGSTPRHKLLAQDFESIRITSTGQVRAFELSAASDEHPFGRLLPNETVVFESGSSI